MTPEERRAAKELFKKHLSSFPFVINEPWASLEKLLAHIDEQERLLRESNKHFRHHPSCLWHKSDQCDCGVLEMVAKIKAALGG